MLTALDLAWIHWSSFALGALTLIALQMIASGVVIWLSARAHRFAQRDAAQQRSWDALMLQVERGHDSLYAVKPSDLIAWAAKSLN